MGLATAIADAVAAELNAAPAGTFSQTMTPERDVLPEFSLPELAQLRVSVVPKSIEMTRSTRTGSQYDITVDIGIQKKLEAVMDAEVAELGTFVDEVADYLDGRALTETPYAVWTKTANDPVYAPDHLAEQRVFTSVLTVTYRAMK